MPLELSPWKGGLLNARVREADLCPCLSVFLFHILEVRRKKELRREKSHTVRFVGLSLMSGSTLTKPREGRSLGRRGGGGPGSDPQASFPAE